MKFGKIKTGERFHFKRGQHVYVKTDKKTAVRDDATGKVVTLSADDELVVLPTCSVCAMVEPWSPIWLMNWCWTC